MSHKDSFKKNLLFLTTAEFNLVAEVIAHVKFLNQQSRIYVLAPEKLRVAFKKLRNVDIVFDSGNDESLSFSEKNDELIQRLSPINFEHIYVPSTFNTGNPLYYQEALQFSANLKTNNISLINYNMRTFRYNGELFEKTPLCEICNSKMNFYRYTTYPSVSESAPLYSCQSCNFISQDFSIVDRDGLRKKYINLTIPWLNFLGEMVDRDNRENLSAILKHIPKSSTIVDMGCGAGGFEYYARRDREKVNVISFELSRELIDWARTQGINVHSVDITNKREISDKLKSLGCERVDCIHCNNSLEHLVKPYDVLRVWTELLRKGGYIHITIPTVDIIFDDYRGFEEYHLSYFTKETFTKLTEKVGLRIVNSRVYEEDNGAGTASMKFLLQK